MLTTARRPATSAMWSAATRSLQLQSSSSSGVWTLLPRPRARPTSFPASPTPCAHRALSHTAFRSQAIPKGSLSATAPDDSASESAARQAERSMRRFWKRVTLAEDTNPATPELLRGSLLVQLDGRSLKTPGGATLRVPRERPLLAALIAREWDEQTKVLRPHALPLVSFLSATAVPDTSANAPCTPASNSHLTRPFPSSSSSSHPPAPVKTQTRPRSPRAQSTRCPSPRSARRCAWT